MLTRFASRYLWFSPIAFFIVLAPLYHGVGFWAGVTGGVLHLALVAWGMHANHAFTGRDDAAALLLGPMLLIAGGAEVWATGASGPPTAAHPNVALFNQAGLTLGFFVTLLGFASMASTSVSNRGRAMTAMGLSCCSLMFVIWVLVSALGNVMAESPLALAPAQQPEWFQILSQFLKWLIPAGAVGGYLGGAMLSEVSILSGWVGRRTGRLMSIYCLIGMFSTPVGLFLLRPAGSSVSEVPRMVYVFAPFMAPAMMCLVPYYVGVLGLRQAAGTAAGPSGRS
jgi:hypothetical protein